MAYYAGLNALFGEEIFQVLSDTSVSIRGESPIPGLRQNERECDEKSCWKTSSAQGGGKTSSPELLCEDVVGGQGSVPDFLF